MSNFLLQQCNSDSSDDEDYNPEEDPQWKKEESSKKIPKSVKSQEKIQEKLSKIWLEMNNQTQKTAAENQNIDILKLAQEIIKKQHDELNDVKTVVFAGSEYLVDKTGTLRLKTNAELESKNSKVVAKEDQGLSNGSINENDGNVSQFTSSEANNEAFNESSEILKTANAKNQVEDSKEDAKQRRDYLTKIFGKINNKTKVINAVKKSKMDWKQFTKKEQIEDKLERNRKNGLLQKQNFLLQVKENVKSVNSEMARKKVHI